VRVEQSRWKYTHVEASSTGGCTVRLLPHVYPDEPLYSAQANSRTVRPDFVLIRNFPLDSHGDTFKSQLMGLMFAGLPAVNSLHSVFMSMDRALQYAELLKAQKRLPEDKRFGLVPMYYFSNQKISLQVMDSPLDKDNFSSYPLVMKVGNGHSGRGKVKVNGPNEFRDLKGIMALDQEYYTTEPFLDVDFEYRIQKIGKAITCFRRSSEGSWKANMVSEEGKGDLDFQNYECTDLHILWIEECAKMFGGLDICGLDVLAMKDGKQMVIEINDTAIGLTALHYDQDREAIKNLVIEKMNEYLC